MSTKQLLFKLRRHIMADVREASKRVQNRISNREIKLAFEIFAQEIEEILLESERLGGKDADAQH